MDNDCQNCHWGLWLRIAKISIIDCQNCHLGLSKLSLEIAKIVIKELLILQGIFKIEVRGSQNFHQGLPKLFRDCQIVFRMVK